MCIASVPEREADQVTRLATVRRVKYRRPGHPVVIGDLIAVTDDAVLIRRLRGGDAVACWTHGNFDLVAGGGLHR